MDKEQFVKTLTDRIIDHEARPLSTILMFMDNKNQLKNADGTKDKRYHARANAQAGQIFDYPTALGLSFGREIFDLTRKNTKSKPKNATFKSVWDDSRNDWEADSYGLMRGLLNPLSDVDSILDYNYLDGLNY